MNCGTVFIRSVLALLWAMLLCGPALAEEPSAVREDGWFTLVEYGPVPSDFSPPLRRALRDETEIMRFVIEGRDERGELYEAPIEPFTFGTLIFETYKLDSEAKQAAEADLREVAMAGPYIVRCMYRASEGTHFERYFWHGAVPEAARPAQWQAALRGHPLSRVEDPRQACPAGFEAP